MKFAFKITFKLGFQIVKVIDGVHVLDMNQITIDEMAAKIPETEAFLERLTGYRVHIDQVM